MGRLVQYVLILALVDLLFLLTGQLGISSGTSIILQAIINPAVIVSGNWWATLITGTGAIAGLAVVGAVFTGFVTGRSDTLLFATMAGVLALMVGDFIIIFNHLASINFPLAVIIMSPIIVVLALTIPEWLRGKD